MAKRKSSQHHQHGIKSIAVTGYKSICDRKAIDIKPLTLLAGSNSSGKSSIMQPLLMLKQTLEASYDPGPLLLNGPNVKFTAAEQFFSCCGDHKPEEVTVEVGAAVNATVCLHFSRRPKGVAIDRMDFSDPDGTVGSITPNMTHDEILKLMPKSTRMFYETIQKSKMRVKWGVRRERCFLEPFMKEGPRTEIGVPFTPAPFLGSLLRNCIHLPGLRGNPERTYPVTAVGKTFPGTFQQYSASVIAQWQEQKNDAELRGLSLDLELLGLTWVVRATSIDDTQVEVRVGRLNHKSRSAGPEMVNIADVGLGLSQTLPVLVALRVARPGQMVFLEQPEIHLHPLAQSGLARVLADAANRGVRVVVETHSSLILLGIQTIVAKGELSGDKVGLHWFSRDNFGRTDVKSASLDESGAFGDWPEDFDAITLQAQSRYLDATESKLAGTARPN